MNHIVINEAKINEEVERDETARWRFIFLVLFPR